MDRVFANRSSGKDFLAILLLVSVAPFVVFGLQPTLHGASPPAHILALLAFLAAVANAHVFSTFYLVTDRRQLQGVQRPALNILAVPLAFVALNLAVAFILGPNALTTTLPVFILYGTYHFGRQNLGVHAFACQIANRRSMFPSERRAINIGVYCGVGQVLAASIPIFLTHLFDRPRLEATAAGVNSLISVTYVALSVAIVRQVLRDRAEYDARSLATYLISVYFFLPVFLSPLFVGAAALAHGAQYLVFLAYHALGESRLNRLPANETKGSGLHPVSAIALLTPFLLLVGWTFGGHVIGRFVRTQSIGLALVGPNTIYLTALYNAVTLSHYWVDQHLWRMASPLRRAWFASHFSFLRPAVDAATSVYDPATSGAAASLPSPQL